MMVFKRKQIVVLSLALMIIVAGYLQYNYRQSSVEISDKENGKLGEAVYVDNGDTEVASDTKSDSVSASKMANDYFAEAKLEKDVTRGKDQDALKALATDTTVSKEIKTQAQQKYLKLVENSDKEMRIESLIKRNNFDDVVVFFGDDGSVDVTVKAPNLTSSQIAQISDIVSRQANISIPKITIKQVF